LWPTSSVPFAYSAVLIFSSGGGSARADRTENLLGCRHVPGLFFGEDQFAIGKHVQHAAPAQVQLYFFNSGLSFQFALQAPGLTANVGSKKTALDVNSHQSRSSLFGCA